LLNGSIFDQQVADGFVAQATFSIFNDNYIDGLIGALIRSKITAGGDISFICPSKLGYAVAGNSSSTGFGIPAFSCLHFEMTVITVNN